MKGVIRICIFGILLVLASCRSESILEDEKLYQSQVEKIVFFENYNEGEIVHYRQKNLNYSDYSNPAIPFVQSFQVYMDRNPEKYKEIEKQFGRVYLGSSSEIFTSSETGEQMVFFPVYKNDRIVGMMKSVVDKDFTELGFSFYKGNENRVSSSSVYKSFIEEMDLTTFAKCGYDEDGIPCTLTGVEIIGKKRCSRWEDCMDNDDRNGGFFSGTGQGFFNGYAGDFIPPLPSGGGEYTPPNPNPCDKTKDQIVNNDKVKGYIEKVKQHNNQRTGTEIGFRFHKDGSVTDAPKINNHRLSVGDPSILDGFYHDHTSSGVDVFSPQDIASLIEIERYQSVGNKSNAFYGMIAYGDIHYVIRWGNDETNSLPPWGTFTQEKLAQMANEQIQDYYASYSRDKPKLTREERLEKVFYQTLDRMGYGIKNHIVLQKIDKYGNVSTVKQNADGTTTSTPCN